MNTDNQSTTYSAGFSWGFKSDMVSKSQQHNDVLRENSNIISKPRQKRKLALHHEGEEESVNNHHGSNLHRRYIVSKRKSHMSSSILGQPLPLQRGLELMSKDQLQNVLLEVMKMHPQSQQTVNSKIMAHNFSVDKCSELLKTKLENLYESIPYSRSYEMNNLNDYAFVRMKPFILEFLNCLIDCLLDQIPPRVENLHVSLRFLDECTDMVTHLPRFQLVSNNYYYDKCLEQLSYVWCTVIEHIARDVVMAFNDESLLCGWIQKLGVYNDLANGMLSRPLQLFKSLHVVEDGVAQNNPASTSTRNSFTNDNNNGTVAYKP